MIIEELRKEVEEEEVLIAKHNQILYRLRSNHHQLKKMRIVKGAYTLSLSLNKEMMKMMKDYPGINYKSKQLEVNIFIFTYNI